MKPLSMLSMRMMLFLFYRLHCFKISMMFYWRRCLRLFYNHTLILNRLLYFLFLDKRFLPKITWITNNRFSTITLEIFIVFHYNLKWLNRAIPPLWQLFIITRIIEYIKKSSMWILFDSILFDNISLITKFFLHLYIWSNIIILYKNPLLMSIYGRIGVYNVLQVD